MKFKFSGHETFPCRYAWLPKAFRLLDRDPHAIADDVQAMVELGIGKNMVRALRFWLLASGVAERSGDRRLDLTPFGHALLGLHDPYLEDIRTLWLLHWQIATHSADPLFAWYHLLNIWRHPEFSRSLLHQLQHLPPILYLFPRSRRWLLSLAIYERQPRTCL